MNLILKIKKSILLRRFSSKEHFRNFFQDVDLETPVYKATFTVFDTETTGVDPRKAELVSVGALKVENLQLELSTAFHRFIRPSNLEKSSVEVHGITEEELKEKGEEPEVVVKDFLEYAKGTVLVGFNVEFDRKMVEKYTLRFFGIPLPNYRLDVFRLWRRRGGHGKNLREIAQELGVPVTGIHFALDDAYTTALIFLKLVYGMRKEPLKSLPLML